ncbi:nitroreductase family protein [bacterium]|nr:nitroreductase family protein [bacterium]
MFLSLIRQRRSVRKFMDKPVEKEKTDVLIEALLRSPSSKGGNPWEFVVITDKSLLEKLSRSKPHGSSFLKWAPMAFVICADSNVDTWVEDTSIAATFLQLTAESLDLGSCWVQIRGRMANDETSSQNYISDMLNIPEPLKIESIIAVGYPMERKPPHEKKSLNYSKIKLNSYTRQWL